MIPNSYQIDRSCSRINLSHNLHTGVVWGGRKLVILDIPSSTLPVSYFGGLFVWIRKSRATVSFIIIAQSIPVRSMFVARKRALLRHSLLHWKQTFPASRESM